MNKLIKVSAGQWVNPSLITAIDYFPAPYDGDPQRQATVRIKFMGMSELKLYGSEALVFVGMMNASTEIDLTTMEYQPA